MDTITHGIAGSMLARSLSGRAEARAAFVAGAAGAVLPDFDFLFFSTRMEYLRDHRSWTHSFTLLPVLSLALALILKAVFRRARLSILWLFAAVGVASHIGFDWITSFGTMFFTPFSRGRHSLDWVFILDPFFTAMSLATVGFAIVFPSRGRRIAAAGAALLAAYLAICGVLHARALAIWTRMDAPPPGARVAVLPQFLSPFRWLGLSESDGEIRLAFFDIGPFARGRENPRPPTKFSEVFTSLSDFYPAPERARIERYEKPPASPFLSAVRGLEDWRIYLDFARFPLETVYPEPDGGATVIVQDLRFLPWFTGPWERGGPRYFRRQPFVYRIRLDRELRPVDRGFVADGRR